MKRRLYFLFPDATHARQGADDLVGCGIGKRHMHAIARPGVDLDDLPGATPRQRSDLLHHLERLLWNTNLALFFGALLGLVVGIFYDATLWTVIMGAVMVITLFLGVLDTTLPDAGLDAMRDALRHGEVLLLVDVPPEKVAKVESFLHAHHPEVVTGGVSWTIERLGM